MSDEKFTEEEVWEECSYEGHTMFPGYKRGWKDAKAGRSSLANPYQDTVGYGRGWRNAWRTGFDDYHLYKDRLKDGDDNTGND